MIFSEVRAQEHQEDAPVRNDWVFVFFLYFLNITKYNISRGSVCVYRTAWFYGLRK